jgi:hypothetical protein
MYDDRHRRHHEHKIDEDALTAVQTNWTGNAQYLTIQSPNLVMSPTPTGSMVFVAQQQVVSNNQGQLTITSGGTYQNLQVPANLQAPTVLINNWGGNDLTVGNTSQPAAGSTTIVVMGVGMGLPGLPAPLKLTPPSSTTTLNQYQAASGTTAPAFMTLRMTCPQGTAAIVTVIGGPANAGNNAYVFYLNSTWGSSGPPSGSPSPGPPSSTTDYYVVTGSNTYDFVFNWAPASQSLFVCNLSPLKSIPVTFTLTQN